MWGTTSTLTPPSPKSTSAGAHASSYASLLLLFRPFLLMDQHRCVNLPHDAINLPAAIMLGCSQPALYFAQCAENCATCFWQGSQHLGNWCSGKEKSLPWCMRCMYRQSGHNIRGSCAVASKHRGHSPCACSMLGRGHTKCTALVGFLPPAEKMLTVTRMKREGIGCGRCESWRRR